MLGNHALARGAVEAGVELVSAYPGTPSSEIVEALNEASIGQGFYAQWSTNEKVAFDVAAGASLVGAKALVAMKSAGINVAMDTFVTVPYGGIKGSLVVVVADDPDAHFSSTEHDSRPLAKQAEILCLEPADAGEAKEMVRQAFDLSHQLQLPVMVRTVSRVSHGSANVTLGPIQRTEKKLGFNKHYDFQYRWNVYGPPGTRSKHEWLVKQFPKLEEYAEKSPFNQLKLAPGSRIGIIAGGLGSAYAYEAIRRLGLQDQVNWLKLGTAFPIPTKMVGEVLKNSDKVLIVDEGTNWIEGLVREIAQRTGARCEIVGKGLDQAMPMWGELDTDMVVRALAPLVGAKVAEDSARKSLKDDLAARICPRSSTLCAGCPHLGSYWGLRLALQRYKDGVHLLNGDIGCYEQAGYGIFAENLFSNDDSHLWKAQSVYEMLDTIYVMGSALGMAQGQALAGYKDGKVVAVAGDSTFFHACLPSVANTAWNGGQVVFMVLDNRWTAMTGHQASPTTGRVGNGSPAKSLDIATAAKALGFDHVLTADAFDIRTVKTALDEAFKLDGPVVLVVSGECRLQTVRRERNVVRPRTTVDTDKCNGCGTCLQLGCPALGVGPDGEKSEIDQILCNSCGLCAQVCNRKAINLQGGAH
jgi:indolepyruvate ferredoxin oxidoreductase alpha subunit